MFAFVMPLIHPEHKRVKDYDLTLLALRGTLDNLLSQTHQDISVIVCCNRLPPWHAEIDQRVHFVVLEEHPELPFEHYTMYNTKASILDQGIKNLIGISYAQDQLNAEFVMVMDADDFVRADLAENASSGRLPAMGKDGWNISGGYQIELEPTGSALNLRTVYQVKGFHRNCGSCRIFSVEAFEKNYATIAPTFAAMRHEMLDATTGLVKSETLEAILSDIRANSSQNSPFAVFAVHKRQERLFDFADISEPVAAKGCGHSNHAGHDGIFWYRVMRQCHVDQFMHAFGMSQSTVVLADPEPVSQIRTQARAFWGKLRQVPVSLKVRFGWATAK